MENTNTQEIKDMQFVYTTIRKIHADLGDVDAILLKYDLDFVVRHNISIYDAQSLFRVIHNKAREREELLKQ